RHRRGAGRGRRGDRSSEDPAWRPHQDARHARGQGAAGERGVRSCQGVGGQEGVRIKPTTTTTTTTPTKTPTPTDDQGLRRRRPGRRRRRRRRRKRGRGRGRGRLFRSCESHV